MKKFLLLCCLLTPAMAYAQTAPSTAPPSAGPSGQGHGERFEEMKAKITQHLQETMACVQAAQNAEALKACRPKRPEGQGGPGGQESGVPPQGAPNAWTQTHNMPSP